MWQPVTFEEELLKKYYNQNPGQLYLKVKLGDAGDISEPINIFSLLLEDGSGEILLPEDYTITRLEKKSSGSSIKVIESCPTLNSETAGNLLVISSLVQEQLSPASLKKILLCSESNKNLVDFCDKNNIKVIEYSDFESDNLEVSRERGQEKFIDIRKKPDESRRRAFLKGWDDAVGGDLYTGAYRYKTHANMGNLFGWIYGDVDEKFRERTWERYIGNSIGEWN